MVPPNTIKVLLADDHPVVREGLRSLLDIESDLRVVGQADDGRQAVELARTLHPDVVVMDLSMPHLSGLQATEQIKRDRPAIKVLALTVHESEAYLQQLIAAGASGYVLKRTASAELVRAVRAVAGGATYFDRELAQRHLVNELARYQVPGSRQPARLSSREEEVLKFFAWGHTSKEIAAQLGVSIKTVETYKTRLCRKLGLRSRPDIVRFALRQGWLKEE